MDITLLMSLVLCTCVLFISFMQLINGAQFLNITFLLVLFASASAAAVLLTLKRLSEGAGGQFDPRLWFFQKCVFQRKGGVLLFCFS